MTRDDAIGLHEHLTADGWQRRFTAQEPRLTEMKEFYESLGLEVKVVEGGIAEDGEECTACFDLEGFSDLYKTIYTRGEPAETPDDDELYE